MATNNKNKTVTINDINAKLATPEETAETLQNLAIALKGTYGSGEFDGGLGTGAEGYYHRYAMYWDAKLVCTASGSTTITFPFTLVNAEICVLDVATNERSYFYADGTKQFTFNGNGKTVISTMFIKNTKEVQ